MREIRCAYCPPLLGDVALISAVWDDDARGPQHAALPILGTVPLLGWIAAVPEPVQAVMRDIYDQMRQGGLDGAHN